MPRPVKIPESVLVVIHTAALSVLLIERADKPGFWQSVTGSKDLPDEALVETAVREVGEETGIVIGTDDNGGHDGAPKSVPDRVPNRVPNRVPHREPHAVPLSNLRDWGLQNIYEIYPVWRHRYADGVSHNTEHVFGLLVPQGIAVRLNPREHLRHQWLPWREAADRCFSPSNAEAILQLPRFLSVGIK